MDPLQELLDATAKVDFDAMGRRQNSLLQRMLTVRAKAAIAGLIDMEAVVKADKDLQSQEGQK